MASSPYGSAQAGNQSSGYQSGGGLKETLRVASARCGLVIGKGGESIKQIQAMSGARVQLDNANANPNAPEKEFQISGTPEQVSAAKRMILVRTSRKPQDYEFNPRRYLFVFFSLSPCLFLVFLKKNHGQLGD